MKTQQQLAVSDSTLYVPRFLHVHRNVKTAEGRGPGSACEPVFHCGPQKPVQHLQPACLLLRLLLPHVWKTYRWVPSVYSGSFQSSVVSWHIVTTGEIQLFDNPYLRRIHSSLCILLKVNKKTGRISFYCTKFRHGAPVGRRSAFETENQDIVFWKSTPPIAW